jgi:hypothetical protein
VPWVWLFATWSPSATWDSPGKSPVWISNHTTIHTIEKPFFLCNKLLNLLWITPFIDGGTSGTSIKK